MNRNVLVLSPHSDDMEISCGGTVSKFIEEGYKVYNIVFSYAVRSIPKEYGINSTKEESEISEKLLGVESLLSYVNYGVRHLYMVRDQILECLIKVKKRINPIMVFLPCSNDVHQDHQVIHNEGLRAFRLTSMFG